ncbi:MAG: hypothetical protein V9H26_10200 [Verrucomicrobiota bacterium]
MKIKTPFAPGRLVLLGALLLIAPAARGELCRLIGRSGGGRVVTVM